MGMEMGMGMFRRGLCLLSLFLSMAAISPAKATTVDWTFDATRIGPGGNGSLTFDSGVVTAIDGTWDGMTITGLVDPNAYVENDNNFFYPSSPYLDFDGILFSLSNGVLVNLYYLAYGNQPPYQAEEVNDVGVLVGDASVGTFAVTPAETPLPGSLPLFATGIAALGLLYWRRKAKAAVAV